MRKGSLYEFNPHNTGLYEARLWKAYYDRRWVQVLVLLLRLLRSQFYLAPLAALRAAYWYLRAAIIFAPPDHDDMVVRCLLQRCYAVVRANTDGCFDPYAAGAAEHTYWLVHRQLAGRKDQGELVEALTALSAQVYGLTLDQARPSAAQRARACDLVDDITGGRQAPTPAAWAGIEQTLRHSYALLRRALQSARTA